VGAFGLPAYLLTSVAERVVEARPGVASALTAGVFATCGLYQLAPLKTRCLRHCRSPLSLLLHYGSYRGGLRDVRAGLHHGTYCLGCCWALMTLFTVVGVMNVAAMVALAAVVLAEKVRRHGEVVARAAGVTALAAAVAVLWMAGLAPGFPTAPPVGM